MNIRPILVFPLLSAIASAAAGQVPVEDHTIRLDVNLVVINVSVSKKNGDTVSGLGKQAFQLFVDDSPLPITYFTEKTRPSPSASSWTIAPAWLPSVPRS